MKSYARMVRHDARPAPGSLSGYQLYNMHNWTQGTWKARIKARSLRQAYETENNRKSENVRLRAYVQSIAMCAWSGYMQLLLLREFLWLATSAKYWSQGAHDKQGKQEDKDQAFRKKNIIKVIHKQDSKASN
jgi:hypothetical protein